MGIVTWWRRQGFVWAFCAFTAAVITYVGLSTFRPEDTTTDDSRQYLLLATGGGAGEGVPKPFRYRLVVPWLVRHLPSASGDALRSLEIRFGIVDVVALFVAGIALHALLRAWGAAGAAPLLGVCLFYLSHPVLLFAGIPLVESAAVAALIVAMLAAERGWWVTFALVVLVGVFIKETTVLALVYPLLTGRDRRWRLALLALPGVLAYAVYRLAIDPVDYGYAYSATAWIGNLRTLVTPDARGATAWREIVLSLGILWIPLVVGLRRRDGLIPVRYAWFIGICALVPLLLSTDHERVVFLAFPVALGLALPTLLRWVSRADAPLVVPPVAAPLVVPPVAAPPPLRESDATGGVG